MPATSSPAVAASPEDDGSRRLTRYYILALSAVALLSIAGQLLVQSRLVDQLGDSKLVNVAGRQRMLSQRIVKCALILQVPAAAAEQKARRSELRTSLDLWRRCHDELRRGDVGVGSTGGNSAEAAAIFARLEPTFAAMSAAAERIAGATDVAAAEDVSVLLGAERTFLERMDEIVVQYEHEAQAKVARLRTLEGVLLALTLGTLLIEGLYVFRPAVRQIRRFVGALVTLGDELRAARDVAESANRAKSQFLANVSHELRTPLHAILGGVEMGRRGPRASDSADHEGRVGEALELIGDSARRQLALVNDLLDLSKIEAGRLDLADETFDLRELLASNAALIRPIAEARGLRFVVDFAADLPRFVRGDALRIGQVLTNLLGNACKFTETGEILLRVYACRDVNDAREVRCVVRDTGIGIPPEHQQHIFQSFAQVDSSGRRLREGAGLGLTVSKQLAELMDGRLEVESRPGIGSTFVFAWPCREVPPPEPSTAAQADRVDVASGAVKRQSLKVLAVDDASPGRRVLESMLIDLGHRPICVADGLAALAAFRKEPFDVVLLDLHMPHVDGRTTAASLRQFEGAVGRRRARIYLVTADATVGRGAAPFADTVDGHLIKPFSTTQLAGLLATSSSEFAASQEAPSPGDAATTREEVLVRLSGNEELLSELIGLFVAESAGNLARLRQAAEKGDRGAVAGVAHLLGGQLAMFGHPEASHFLKLETMAEVAPAETIVQELDRLERRWSETLRQVQALSPAAHQPLGKP